MSGSSQKFIARNRAPRVQIEYDVELYGAEKKVQLPFVMGVMSDLSGKSEKPPVDDRKFLEIDVDNFDERMGAVAPRAAFTVPNTLTGEGNIAVDLTFNKMSDFSPEAIAAKTEGLAPLLAARKQLADLMTYMDGKAGAETLIEQLLASPALMAAVSGSGGEAGDTDAALEALRAMGPPVVEDEDTTGDTLAALAAAAPAEEAPKDETADVLASMERRELAEEEDTTDAVLGGIEAVEAAGEDDSTDDVLSGIEAVEEVAETDATDDILGGIEAVETPEEVDATDDVLSAIEAVEDAPNVDETDDILGGIEAVDAPEETDTTDDVLGAIEAVDTAEEADDTDDILGAIDAVEDAGEDDTTDDVLGAIEGVEDTPDEDPTDDILSGIEAVEEAEESESAEDVLAGIEAVDAPEQYDDTDDVLGALETVEEVEEEDTSDDILAEIEAVEEAAEDDLDDILGGVEAVEESAEDEGVDDVLAGIESAESEEAEVDAIDDILEGLEAVEAGEEEDALDDILGGLEAADEPDAEDDLEDILGGLESAEETEEADDLDDILGGVEATEETEESDDLDDILGGLEATEEADEGDDLDDILGGLEATEETDEDDDLDDILGGLEASEEADAGDDLDDILGGLEDAGEVKDGDDLEDILGGLDAGEEDAEGDDLDDILGGLEAGEADESGDDLEDILGTIEASDDEESGDDLDEILGGLGDEGDDDLDALLADAGGEDDDLDALLADGESGDDALLGEGDDDLDALLADTDTDDLLTDAEDSAPAAPKQSPFGRISAPRPAREDLGRSKFRMALFGDFSGRAARGLLEPGAGLRNRKPILLDVDTVEDVIESFATTLLLPIGKDGAGMEVPLKELDDLHPDELYDNLEIFEAIKGLRQQLGVGSMAAKAEAQLKDWAAAHGRPIKLPKVSAATNVPADRKLSDFQALIGDTTGRLSEVGPIDTLLAQIVGPHVVKAPDAGSEAMKAAVDEALSSAMRLVLHHPDFQAVEAQWRSLDLLARRIETDSTLEIVLYDVSAEELAADLAAQEDLSESGLFGLLTDVLDPEEGAGGFSALFGLYTFAETPPHAELLARIGQVGAHVDAPFFAAMTPSYLETPKEERHPLVAEAWDTLRDMPEAHYVALSSPRFLLRLPYGQKSEPIYPFEFEEFTPQVGLRGMLWANPAVLVMILLAGTYKKDGKAMDLGTLMSLGDLPFHYVTDRHGDQVALPCTERNLTSDAAQMTLGRGFMPVVWVKGRNEIRLGSFCSLAGTMIAGPWEAEVPKPRRMPGDPSGDVMLATQLKPSEAPAPDADDALGGFDAGDDDDDLLGSLDADDDDMFAGLDDDEDTSLDDLLAGFGDDDEDEDGDDDDMDDDLAALLEGL